MKVSPIRILVAYTSLSGSVPYLEAAKQALAYDTLSIGSRAVETFHCGSVPYLELYSTAGIYPLSELSKVCRYRDGIILTRKHCRLTKILYNQPTLPEIEIERSGEV